MVEIEVWCVMCLVAAHILRQDWAWLQPDIFDCHYAVIWDALKAACESDLQTAQLIVNSAGIIVTVPDLSTCFDERGKHPGLKHWLQQAVCGFPLFRNRNACATSAMHHTMALQRDTSLLFQCMLTFVPLCKCRKQV